MKYYCENNHLLFDTDPTKQHCRECASAPSPEELAREAENLIDIVNDSLFSFEQKKKKHIVAALLRSRMERAERCDLCKSGDIPIGHLYHFTDEGRESCKNCRCVECLPSAPDKEKK